MLLVVANMGDPRGPALRRAWNGAELLTPADLSQRGWSFDPSDPQAGQAVIAGRRVPARDIRGICALLSAVADSDLRHIAAIDRSYVAAELTAFLAAWLVCMPCPKVNPPSPVGLSGPNWRRERWICTAARLGLPVRGADRTAPPGTARTLVPRAEPEPGDCGSRHTIVVAGTEVLGAVGPEGGYDAPAKWAARLAGASGVRMLNVHIGADARGPFVLGADVWVDTSRPGVADALRRELTGRAL
jgi:hypothetical protein